VSGFMAHGVRSWRFRSVLAFVLILAATNVAWAQSPVMRVEEDWVLVISLPDIANDSPQITCSMSPASNLDGIYAAFELNHRSLPDYQAGGLQLQVWNGENLVEQVSSAHNGVCNTENERIDWTQSMSIVDGSLVLEVLQGSSTTWGAFGSGTLRYTVPAPVADLSAYHPLVSVRASGVGFGANRVQSLVLKRVRYYDGNGNLLGTDNTERYSHGQQ